MHGSTELFPIRPLAPPRRLILGTALALALAVSLAPRTPDAVAQESRPAATTAAATAPAAPAAGDSAGAAAGSAAKVAPEAAIDDKTHERADVTVKAEKDSATGQRTITVKKNGKTVTVTGDREFDSFDQMVHTEPAIAIMVILVVAVVCFAPVLAIALILLYRMRKARMQNETMLKLAERGVVGPGEAIAAVASGDLPPRVASDVAAKIAASAGAPSEQMRAIRKHAAWSDLRKGVVMGAIGLGLTCFSLFEDRSPNSVGLVFLFLGIGYVVLWWFEERQVAPRANGGGTPPGTGPGSAL